LWTKGERGVLPFYPVPTGGVDAFSRMFEFIVEWTIGYLVSSWFGSRDAGGRRHASHPHLELRHPAAILVIVRLDGIPASGTPTDHTGLNGQSLPGTAVAVADANADRLDRFSWSGFLAVSSLEQDHVVLTSFRSGLEVRRYVIHTYVSRDSTIKGFGR
jgi:hypothetical protein